MPTIGTFDESKKKWDAYNEMIDMHNKEYGRAICNERQSSTEYGSKAILNGGKPTKPKTRKPKIVQLNSTSNAIIPIVGAYWSTNHAAEVNQFRSHAERAQVTSTINRALLTTPRSHHTHPIFGTNSDIPGNPAVVQPTDPFPNHTRQQQEQQGSAMEKGSYAISYEDAEGTTQVRHVYTSDDVGYETNFRSHDYLDAVNLCKRLLRDCPSCRLSIYKLVESLDFTPHSVSK